MSGAALYGHTLGLHSFESVEFGTGCIFDAKILSRNWSFAWYPSCLPEPVNDGYRGTPGSGVAQRADLVSGAGTWLKALEVRVAVAPARCVVRRVWQGEEL